MLQQVAERATECQRRIVFRMAKGLAFVAARAFLWRSFGGCLEGGACESTEERLHFGDSRPPYLGRRLVCHPEDES